MLSDMAAHNLIDFSIQGHTFTMLQLSPSPTMTVPRLSAVCHMPMLGVNVMLVLMILALCMAR